MLSYIHPVFEVTGLEGGNLASELAWLPAAKQYGFGAGFWLYDLENAPLSDLTLLAGERGRTFLT